ncbi:MAG TPA: metalloregulator ArsR/SmtB family transcription factor [Dehalococcoidia bacterium]|nr:metalloregulator ArsR/SmtB family transcription factor [Dehalococcoidia bacterium]
MTSMEPSLAEPKGHLPVCCAPVLPSPTPETATLVRAFRALGDETRLGIVRLLAQAPEVCVCHIGTGFSLGQPTISHHLKVLREAGLVDFTKRGLWAYYFLRRDLPTPVWAAIAALDPKGDTDDVQSAASG